MDQNRFDALARSVAAGTSRRKVLRGMLGGAVVAVAAGTRLDITQAATLQETCAGSGEACENVEGSCCDPYTCFEGMCSVPKGCVDEGMPCVDDFPCCEDAGLSCVEGICSAGTGTCAGSGEACEMVDGSCCEPYTCFEGLCDIPKGCVSEGLPCVDDFPCCEDEGLSCQDGICAASTGGVGSLPNTGAGSNTEHRDRWMGAALAAGAAVVAAAGLRNRTPQESDENS